MMNGLGSTTVKISACHAEQKQQQSNNNKFISN